MDDFGKSTQFDNDDFSETSVSRSPLSLDGSGAAPAPKTDSKKPVVPALASQEAAGAPQTVANERITGVKTFFTKLHPGAIQFLDEQITKWLKENPDIVIKRTNIIKGEITAKKTEPNIIITVWY